MVDGGPERMDGSGPSVPAQQGDGPLEGDRLAAVEDLLDAALAAEAAGDFRGAAARSTEALERLRSCPDVPGLDALRLEVLTDAADHARANGELDRARALALEAVALAEVSGPPMALGRVLNVLGIACRYAGRHEAAKAAYLRAFDLLTETEGDPGALAAICHNLAGLAHERGRPEEGIGWAERGLVIRRVERPEDLFGLASDLGALAALQDQLGRTNEAEAGYREALASFEALLGPDHYEVGVVCGNLGRLLVLAGAVDEGVSWLERALTIKERSLGADHRDLAVTLVNLARGQAALGRNADAERAAQRAIDLRSHDASPGDPSVVLARQILAQVVHR